MAEYLDGNGLRYYDGKLRDYVRNYVQNYFCSEEARVYGVRGVGSENPLNVDQVAQGAAYGLTRVLDSADKHVTVNADGTITSDFDSCFPFGAIHDVVDDYGNVFVRIPKFYSKITRDSDGTYTHLISGTRHAGFATLFIDGRGNELPYVDVGKYECGTFENSKAISKTGKAIQTGVSIIGFRTACRANGAGYQQYDFIISHILKELWLVEMATTNCQSIMQGYSATANSAKVNTGTTDAVSTPSGSPGSNATGTYACKYRGVENIWGNTYKWVDGINFTSYNNGGSPSKIYICTDPTKYESDKYDGAYTYVGNRVANETPSNSIVKAISYFPKFPLLGFISDAPCREDNAAYQTYYSDYAVTRFGSDARISNTTVLEEGGRYSNGERCGLWRWDVGCNSSDTGSNNGGRLCYKPLI